MHSKYNQEEFWERADGLIIKIQEDKHKDKLKIKTLSVENKILRLFYNGIISRMDAKSKLEQLKNLK